MTIFPELTPSSRTFTPGRHPHSEISTINGLQSRVRMSNAIVDQRLQLTFVALTEAQMLSIHSHYIDRQGRFLSFEIPDSLLSGMSAPDSFTPIGNNWLYAGSPEVEDVPGVDRFTVTVELVNMPGENATARGSLFVVPISFEPGVASVETAPPEPGGTTTLEFDPPLEIDGAFDTVLLEVAGLTGTITKVTFTVNFTKLAEPSDPFTYNQDISFYLANPDSSVFIALAYDFPVGQDGLSASATITYDDDFPPYTANTLTSGSYSPADPLSFFNGGNPNGFWEFTYEDYFPAGDPLQIHSVSITVVSA